jgi:hypothetical protein
LIADPLNYTLRLNVIFHFFLTNFDFSLYTNKLKENFLILVPTITPLTQTFVATIRVGAVLLEPPANGRTNNRIIILMSSGAYFTMKTAQWRQNNRHRLGFAGRVPSGDGAMLRVAGAAEIILSSF